MAIAKIFAEKCKGFQRQKRNKENDYSLIISKCNPV